MLLNIIGHFGLCILGIYAIFLIYIIRKRVYVQFYLSFMSLIAIASFIYIILNHINHIYCWLALAMTYASLLAVTIFERFGLRFINSIIRFIADIYREIVLFGLSEDNEIMSDIKDKYKSKDTKTGELVGYTRSFIFSNIEALQKYGLENGYVPNAYIDDFRQAFSKTIQKVEVIENNYIEKLSSESKKAYIQELNKIRECLMEEGKQTWEDAYIRNTEKKKSRKEFLMDVDSCKDSIINNHIQSYKRKYPEIFED